MKHIKLFETEVLYQSFKTSDEFSTPNVSLVESTNTLYCTTENYITATYNIYTTGIHYILGEVFNIEQIQTMYVDGIATTPSLQFNFTTTGEHSIRFVMRDSVFTSCEFMFANTNISSINIAQFNTSNVTSMAFMFGGVKEMFNFNLHGLDLSNVQTMEGMFIDAQYLLTVDFGESNLPNIFNINGLFSGCPYITDVWMRGDINPSVSYSHDILPVRNGQATLHIPSQYASNYSSLRRCAANNQWHEEQF